ncbi:S41 family peptidase [Winogradskyella sp.]|uniref:S41 family peptidase n=1 Tax=Winogradskyella sp. TaxID=1883156 RepID=UPI0026395787|nr:S41 family peptidase [uncultured Winogradskyella sp.]
MMKNLKLLALLLAVTTILSSCSEDFDDNLVASSSVKDFVWKGMNAVYLYKSEIPDLANDRFATNEEYSNYLADFESPEALFESLKHQPETIDRFSIITDNYINLRNQFLGVSLNNGLEFNLYFVPGSSTDIFGAITLVLNDSEADNSGLQRDMIFRAVDGTNLTASNYPELLSQETYTLNFADYDNNGTEDVNDDIVTLNGESETLTKVQYSENPIHIAKTITLDNNTKVGYLMYNQFNSNFNNALNNVFGDFASNGVTELVLDLRYNGGGSVQTAAYLGSMITGQFTGQVYSKAFYNENLASNNRDYLFTNSIGAGGAAINSLNLNKVYVLTTNRRTASASELVINSLSAYIDVVVIGENTVGKTQISTTIYDSPDLGYNGRNPGHFYAMQPLVANSVNVNDELVPTEGLTPNIELREYPSTLGVLGEINEPLLEAALQDISGSGRFNYNAISGPEPVNDKRLFKPFEQEMYIDNE